MQWFLVLAAWPGAGSRAVLWLGSEVAPSAEWGTWDRVMLGQGTGSGGPLLQTSMANAKLCWQALGGQPASIGYSGGETSAYAREGIACQSV